MPCCSVSLILSRQISTTNTNASAFAISREMVEAGVDPFEVAQHVFGSYSLGRLKLLNLALNSIEISPNGKLSLMTVTRGMLEETRTQQEDVDALHQLRPAH